MMSDDASQAEDHCGFPGWIQRSKADRRSFGQAASQGIEPCFKGAIMPSACLLTSWYGLICLAKLTR
jgi:hypothetical protein